MISFSADKTSGLIEITMCIETWKVKEFFWRIINHISLRLGKGWYFIDCGYCDRVKGKMVCLSHARMTDDKTCYPVECNTEGMGD